MENIAVQILEETGQTLEDFEYCCGELADEVLHRHPDAMILYLEPEDQLYPLADLWSYHMVPIVDGIVHDAWFPKLTLCPQEYVRKAFPNENVKVIIFP